MSRSRNLWVLLGLASLLGIVVFGLWRRGAIRPAAVPQSKEVQPVSTKVSTEVHFRDEVRKLEPEHPIEVELKGGEGDRYEVDLPVGQFVHLVADQRGIDVTLRLQAPDGTTVFKVDSLTPTGNMGPEHIFVIPEISGIFHAEVFSTDASAPAGHYEIKLENLRRPEESDRDHVLAFKLLMEGEDLRRNGDMAGACEKYEAALARWRKGSGSEWIARSLYLIGWVSKDDPKRMTKALDAYREAIPLLHALGKRDEEGMALSLRGYLELRNGAVDDAIDLQRQAITIFQELRRPDLEAGALNSLGAAYEVASKAQKGLDAYRLALTRAREGNRLDEEGSALRGIGSILINQGKLEPAMDSLREALAAFQKSDAPDDVAYVSSRMAWISQRLGRLDDALSQLKEALTLQQRSGDLDGQVETLNSMGTLHLLRRETAQAGSLYTQAHNIAKSTHKRYDEAISLLNLARCRFDAGDPRGALDLHEQAASLFHEMHFRRGEVSTLYGSARALHAMGDHLAARERLERVVEGVEALREESQSQDLRSAYFATKQHYFDLHIDVLMHLHEKDPSAGYDAQALLLNERRRARSLLEILTAPPPKAESGTDPTMLAREHEIRQQLNATVAQLLTDHGDHSPAMRSRLEQSQSELLLELANIEGQLRSQGSEPTTIAKPPALTVSGIQKLIGKWGLLLVYSLGEERSFLWSLAGDGKIASYSLPSRASLEEMAEQVRSAWGHRGGEHGPGARWAARLSKELLGPVAGTLGEKRLIILGDGALETLPFAALPDPRALSETAEPGVTAEPLVARNEVVHLPSIAALATLRGRKRLAPPPEWLGIIADPVFSADDPRVKNGTATGGTLGTTLSPNLGRAAEDLGIQQLERLPHTRTEATEIAKLVPRSSRVALDFEASRALVESKELRRYRFLHFATHGLLNSQHPELSGLVLSLVDPEGHPQEDGFLLAHEISSLDLKAQLVVLSACQTGLGGEVRGEGLVGLTRSFMSAGIPQVVVSLWNVNDEATAELMTRFYRAMILKGLPPSSALRCAQLSLRKQEKWSSPYFWAPFIFQGDWGAQGPPQDDSIEQQVLKSKPPPVSDTDFPPPGSGGTPTCPELP